MSNPWYPHYCGDYLRDTAHLTLAQHGAYRLLLDHYYSTAAPLPADLDTLYRICRASNNSERTAVRAVLDQFFRIEPNGLHNQRADRQLQRQAELHDRHSKGARKTNEKRWGASLSESLSDSLCESHIQSQSQSQREEKKTPAAKTTPRADPRHQGFFDCAYQVFKMRYGQPPTWAGREGKQLQAFLKSNVRITQEEWEQRYRNFLKSTSPFYAEKCGSLLFFISNFDHFIDGPVLEKGGPSNGKKLTGNALTDANLKAAGFVQ